MLSVEIVEKILKQELVYATGCTEPCAISYCASVAASEIKKLGDSVDRIEVYASKNILKNAMSAGLPKTTKVGVNYAAGIGALHGNPENKLNVNNDIDEETYVLVSKMIDEKKITVDVSDKPNVLYIDITVYGKNHKARAIIADEHTRIISIDVDGKNIFKDGGNHKSEKLTPDEIASYLTIKNIYEFCTQENYYPIEMVHRSEEVNKAISDAGLVGDYGLGVGKMLKKDIDSGKRANNSINKAIMYATAGSDARMVGAPYPVVTNSGSGNQGITITMPVISVARDLGVSDEIKYRALTMAHLCSIRIKSKFGPLSAFCGAAIASTGAACGIAYLYGGDYDVLVRTISNMFGTVTGMMCDGAKPDCSLKIYAGLQAAFEAVYLALDRKRVEANEGIVCQDVEDTIDNVCDLSKNCSDQIDTKILHYMLNKK